MRKFVFLTLFLVSFSVWGNDLNISARVDFYRSRSLDMSLSQEERFRACDSLIHYLELQGKTKEALQNRIEYAQRQGIIGNYLTALHLYEQVKFRLDSLSISDTSLFPLRLRCFFELGRTTMNIGLYPQSVQYFFDVLNLCTEKEADYLVKAYSHLVLLFVNMKQEKQAYYYVNLAKELVNSRDSLEDATLFVYQNNLAGLYYTEQNYDSAIQHLSIAKNFVSKETDRAVLYYNLGNIYLGIDEIGLAKEYLKQVLSGINDTTLFGYVHISACINLAYVYGIEGNYRLSLEYYRKALDMATKVGSKKLEATIYIEMSAVYKQMKEYVQALELLEKGIALKESLLSSDQIESINFISSEYQQKERKMEMEMLEKQLEYARLSNRHKNMILGILWGLLGIFVLSFGFALYNWRKQRQHVQVLDNKQRTQDRRHVMESEGKVKELAAANLQLVQATEIIAECRTEVKKMRSSKPADHKEILKHLDTMLSSFQTDSAWDEFELYFLQLHNSFFSRLHQVCPELTRNEQRTCALLVLNFSVKEIAGITHRSVRTVEAAIYQIRKKMNIPTETRTLTYLQQFLS